MNCRTAVVHRPTTTLGIYAHLFEDNHADAMAALDAMTSPTPNANNVVRLTRLRAEPASTPEDCAWPLWETANVRDAPGMATKENN